MLKDIRVLDLADEKGGFCSKLLADLGASVIKIEQPQKNKKGNTDLKKYSYAYLNANKHSITFEPELIKDKKTFLRLVNQADVLVETFRPGYLEAIGLGYETLQKENPGVIHVSITGFVQYGPGRTYRSCDLVASASGGQMYVMGNPSERPCVPFGGQSYYVASLFGAVRALLALRKRSLTGTVNILICRFKKRSLPHSIMSWWTGFTKKPLQDDGVTFTVTAFFAFFPAETAISR